MLSKRRRGGDDPDGDLEATNVMITHTEGAAALETALRYVEQQNDATAADILLIKRWRDNAAKNIRRQ